jgi:hypothetical protein
MLCRGGLVRALDGEYRADPFTGWRRQKRLVGSVLNSSDLVLNVEKEGYA